MFRKLINNIKDFFLELKFFNSSMKILEKDIFENNTLKYM